MNRAGGFDVLGRKQEFESCATYGSAETVGREQGGGWSLLPKSGIGELIEFDFPSIYKYYITENREPRNVKPVWHSGTASHS